MSIPRSVVLERLVYTAAAPVIAAAPNLSPDGALNTSVVLAGSAAAAGIVATWIGGKKGTTDAAGRKILRMSPVATGSLIDLAALWTPGWYWGLDAAAAATWAAAYSLIVPMARHGRRRHRPALAAAVEPAPAAAVEQTPDDGASLYTRQVRLLWDNAGRPGRTFVVTATPHPGTHHDLTLTLRAAEDGRPITMLTDHEIAAPFDVDERAVKIERMVRADGTLVGPSWLQVHITPDETKRRRKQPSDAERWDDRIGYERGPIPHSQLVDKLRDDERGVTHYIARMPAGMGEPVINEERLAQALGAGADEGCVFVTLDGGGKFLVSHWDSTPLAALYPATRELLTPDAEGRYVVGYLGNGQPARNRCHTDRGAAHGLYVAPSGGGKTQLLALSVVADANWGAVVWLASESPDEKTTKLGQHIDRQGTGALYMLRALRATLGLMAIRGEMVWEDGEVHDWHPEATGCPYRPLKLKLDEFLSAARHPQYGGEIMDLAEQASVKGRKYAIGEDVAGQSIYVHDGFTQLLNENLRENSIPIVLKVAAKKVPEMFKALGVPAENIPAPLPRSFTQEPEGRIERVMKGEPEPAADSNTGGAGWIVENRKPEVLRTLYINFLESIAHLFPEQVYRLTDHEIRELEARGLWFDWTLPPQPGEFGEEIEDEDADDLDASDTTRTRSASRAGGARRYEAEVTTPAQALERIKHLTNT
ncbi:chromosome segregation protein ParM [Streptomyces sp. N35]|uniref:chromosome segregation protein ParM n=1 Tax=Streptomyces sp. N35 TaxID=2795730 RepID=UPI0018F43E7E|nr:chromosome segregation protein ParM [Streptomyces sp. N35]